MKWLDPKDAPENKDVFCKHEYGYDVLELMRDPDGTLFGWTHDGGDRYTVTGFVLLEDVLKEIKD